MQPEELHALTEKYLNGTATAEELQRLQQWYEQGMSGEEETEVPLAANYSSEEVMGSGMLQQINERIAVNQPKSAPVRTMRMIRWVAAACVIVLLCGAAYWLINKQNKTTNEPGLTAQHTGADVLPGSNKATLILSNEQVIILDSAKLGHLAEQNGMHVINAGNSLAYEGTTNKEIVYNTLQTHNGEQYSLTLADGTRVWLNAASSIRFPVAFNGSERRVEITGEAYFEVMPDKSKPFIVYKGETSVRVLGTHFNVNSYEDEPSLQVTLLEGSVEVIHASSGMKIRPGQQAQVTNDKLAVTDDADTDLVMAWKNGYTSFRQADLQMLMRQVARWYDVDIVFNGTIPQNRTFTADLTRNVPLSQLLKILEASDIHCKIEGRRLTILL